MEYKIFPRRRKLHRRELRGVRIHRTKKFRGIETATDFLRRERGNTVIENPVPADEMPDDRVRRKRIGVAGEVVPHEKFSERKMSEPHVFANFPAAQSEHRAAENPKHARNVHSRSIAGKRIESGNFEPVFPSQKFEQRGVDDGVFVAAAQNRTLRGRAAAQAHGHEQNRSAQRVVSVVAFPQFEKTDGEKKRVHAAFLDVGARTAVKLGEAFFQLVFGQCRVKAFLFQLVCEQLAKFRFRGRVRVRFNGAKIFFSEQIRERRERQHFVRRDFVFELRGIGARNRHAETIVAHIEQTIVCREIKQAALPTCRAIFVARSRRAKRGEINFFADFAILFFGKFLRGNVHFAELEPADATQNR